MVSFEIFECVDEMAKYKFKALEIIHLAPFFILFL